MNCFHWFLSSTLVQRRCDLFDNVVFKKLLFTFLWWNFRGPNKNPDQNIRPFMQLSWSMFRLSSYLPLQCGIPPAFLSMYPPATITDFSTYSLVNRQFWGWFICIFCVENWFFDKSYMILLSKEIINWKRDSTFCSHLFVWIKITLIVTIDALALQLGLRSNFFRIWNSPDRNSI